MEDKTQDVAKEFLEMWQKQIDASMRDPSNMQQMMQSMAQMQQQFMANLNSGNINAQTFPANFGSNAPNDVHSPQHGNGELLQLERRLRECEARVAVLESKLGQRS